MVLFQSQVIASTNRDVNGHAIPEDQLQNIFESLEDEWFLCDDHDIGKPPVGRAFNKCLSRLENGHLAICCDVEIFDPRLLDKYGAFSIGASTGIYTLAPDLEPHLTIAFNPRTFPVPVIEELVSASTPELNIVGEELIQKALDTPLVLIISFALGATANGFFKSAGADIYATIKQRIRDWGLEAKQNDRASRCNIIFTASFNGTATEFLVAVDASDIDVLQKHDVSVETIVSHVRSVAGDRQLQKVVVTTTNAGQLIFVDHYIEQDGTIVNCQNNDTTGT